MHGENPMMAFLRLVARNRRRYGGYIVHAGVVMLFCAFAGLAFKREFDVTLRAGRGVQRDRPVRASMAVREQGDLAVRCAQPASDGGVAQADARWPSRCRSSRARSGSTSTAAGSRHSSRRRRSGSTSGRRRMSTSCSPATGPSDTAEIRITFNPLVWWVWYGGMVMAFGGLIVMWPQATGRESQSGYAAVMRPDGAFGTCGSRRRDGRARATEPAGFRRGAGRQHCGARTSGCRARAGTGQQTGQQAAAGPQAAGSGPRTTMSGPMSESAYRPVALPAKPGAKPSMSDGARDALEHQLHCQCGCTLDVFTCRTTDFTCPVSPGMHGDIVALVVGGYTAVEILDAFRKTYGERVLMSPVREGFNWAGYVAPFVGAGGSDRGGGRAHPPVARGAGASGCQCSRTNSGWCAGCDPGGDGPSRGRRPGRPALMVSRVARRHWA